MSDPGKWIKGANTRFARGRTAKHNNAPDSIALTHINTDGQIRTLGRVIYGYGPPPGHAPTPYDTCNWIHKFAAESPNIGVALLSAAKQDGPLYMFVRPCDSETIEVLSSSGYRLCRIVNVEKCQIWTSRD